MTGPRHRRASARATLLAGLTALAVLVVGGTGTLSSWAGAVVTTPTDTARAGSMVITHSDNGTTCATSARVSAVACAASLGTSSSPPANAPTDAITSSSDVAVSETMKASSCGVVQLANDLTGDPMLPHGPVAFSASGGPSGVSGSGTITLGSGAYATAVAPASIGGSPNGGLLGIGTFGYDYGYGVWFKTTSAGGLLLGAASGPSNTPASGATISYDRALTLSGGKVVFTAGGANPVTSGATYNDGAWHFAYASLRSVRSQLTALLGSTSSSVTLYVDGTAVSPASTSTDLAVPTTASWSIGGQGLTGSLSNAVVYNGTSAPTSAPAAPYGGASERWQLNDNGYSTASVALPASYGTPCSQVRLSMTFTGAAANTVSGTLSGLAGVAQPVGTLPAGASQSLTTSTAYVAGYRKEITGLHLYVPLTFAYTAGSAPGWSQTMTWSGDPADVYVA